MRLIRAFSVSKAAGLLSFVYLMALLLLPSSFCQGDDVVSPGEPITGYARVYVYDPGQDDWLEVCANQADFGVFYPLSPEVSCIDQTPDPLTVPIEVGRQVQLYVGAKDYDDNGADGNVWAPNCVGDYAHKYCDAVTPVLHPCLGGPLSFTWAGLPNTTPVDDFTYCTVQGEDHVNFYMSTLYAELDTPGSFEVTCTISDGGAQDVKDEDRTVTFVLNVKPEPPDCSTEDPLTDSCKYAPGGGGGCGGGGCAGGAGQPGPSLADPIIHLPFNPPGGLGGPGANTGFTGPGQCFDEKVDVVDAYSVDACSALPNNLPNLYGVYKNSCGVCCVMSLGTGAGRSNCQGYTIDWTANGVSFVVTHPDGSKSTFTPPAPSGDRHFRSEAIGPSSTQDAAGNTTTFNRDSSTSALESVALPGGNTWLYRHVGGEKITRVIPPGSTVDGSGNVTAGTYTDVTYEQSGPAVGKLHSVTAFQAGQQGATWSSEYTYDSETGLLDTYDQNGHTIKYEYPSSRQIKVTDQSADPQVVTLYDYGDLGSDITIITQDPDGPSPHRQTVYTFVQDNGRNRDIASITERIDTEPNNGVAVATYDYVSYDNANLVRTSTDAGGVATTYTFDFDDVNISTPVGAVTKVVVQGSTGPSRTTKSAYDYVTDTSGKTTAWLRATQDESGNWTGYQRGYGDNAPWRVDAIKVALPGTEPDWSTVAPIKEFTYYTSQDTDGLPGQLKSETVPAIDGGTPQVTTYKYTEVVNGVTKFRTSPTQTTYQYGALGTETVTSSYDDLGHLLYTTDANGRTIWYRYDALGRQTLTVYKWVNGVVDGTPELYAQNNYSCCTLDSTQDENGNLTHYAYDDAKRIRDSWNEGISGQDTDHPLVSYTYDAFGNQKTVTTYSDANTPRTTSYTYDKMNRVTVIDYPGGIVGSEHFGYNAVGSLQWKEDGNGAVTLYQYDTLHRLTNVYYNYTGSLTNIAYPATADVTYGYLVDGVDYGTSVITSMKDSSSTTPSLYTYDDQGRLENYTPPVGLASNYYVHYVYNNLGQKTKVQITNGTTVTYDVTYDYFANGWLKDVKSGGTTIASYSYDPAGNRTQVNYGNGTYAAYARTIYPDARYPLSYITHHVKTANGWENIVLDYRLGASTVPNRDAMGNPLSFEDWTGTWSYGYDAMNRLTTATPPSGPVPSQPAGGPYGYDWVGNRLNPPSGSNQMVYNAADQLTLWPGMHSYGYDNNGALTAVKTADGSTTQQGFTYHPTGLMNEATFPGGTLTNSWDADEHRVKFTATGGTAPGDYTFVFDPTAGIPAVLQENTPTGTVYYIREPGGELIARQTASEGIRYYHFDELGSTRLITDGSGSVADRCTYDAYGAVLSHDRYSGSIDQPYQYVGRLGYYTHWQIAEFGWLQLGVRFYDPQIGRFERRDPAGRIGGGYSYTARPVRAVDPSGRAEWVRVEAPDTGQWWNPAYVHAFIHFSRITCMGSPDWGFYSAGVIPQKDYIGAPKTGDEWWKVVENRNDSLEFERALCECITESGADPPAFQSNPAKGFYVCGSWVADMWACAERRWREKCDPHVICHRQQYCNACHGH